MVRRSESGQWGWCTAIIVILEYKMAFKKRLKAIKQAYQCIHHAHRDGLGWWWCCYHSCHRIIEYYKKEERDMSQWCGRWRVGSGSEGQCCYYRI